MTRTDDDSWDLASSVGATATMVAAGRAVASRDPRGLINDPFAAALVRAVGVDVFSRIADGDLDMADLDSESAPRMQSHIDEMAVRTKFFDDYFETAAAGGIRQAVILASGLDARAYRLAWPPGTVVYEIDQPDVIEFKTRTLDGLCAEPTAERRTVAIDLRNDWPAALQAAGLNPAEPTAWCAEGLLIYLPPDAQDRLFDDIHRLSAPGSAVATEYVPALRDFDPDKARAAAAVFRQHGLDLDMTSLIYPGERHHPGEYLAAKGWRMDGVARSELFARYGLPVPEPDPDNPLGEIIYVSGDVD